MRLVCGDFVICPFSWCDRSLMRDDVADRSIETGIDGAVVCRHCGGRFVWRLSLAERLEVAHAVVGFVAVCAGYRVFAARRPDGKLWGLAFRDD